MKLFSWKMNENDGYGEQKPKMKNTKKMKSSSHKWVLGEILQKLKGCLGKNRECNVYVYVCVCVLWATPATKRRYSKNTAPAEQNTQVLHPAT